MCKIAIFKLVSIDKQAGLSLIYIVVENLYDRLAGDEAHLSINVSVIMVPYISHGLVHIFT